MVSSGEWCSILELIIGHDSEYRSSMMINASWLMRRFGLLSSWVTIMIEVYYWPSFSNDNLLLSMIAHSYGTRHTISDYCWKHILPLNIGKSAYAHALVDMWSGWTWQKFGRFMEAYGGVHVWSIVHFQNEQWIMMMVMMVMTAHSALPPIAWVLDGRAPFANVMAVFHNMAAMVVVGLRLLICHTCSCEGCTQRTLSLMVDHMHNFCYTHIRKEPH